MRAIDATVEVAELAILSTSGTVINELIVELLKRLHASEQIAVLAYDSAAANASTSAESDRLRTVRERHWQSHVELEARINLLGGIPASCVHDELAVVEVMDSDRFTQRSLSESLIEIEEHLLYAYLAALTAESMDPTCQEFLQSQIDITRRHLNALRWTLFCEAHAREPMPATNLPAVTTR
ncbi:hypothetical protein NG895_20950 [Aeoliella sp. ICT_H6.2]|uniref:Uncharacterized protein n=1 Tax=Aeoliella straminimaris TaxID=2954799 RepID=A0A9X2JHT6_9BACT|nr:hypothetical protein [Aeoliella straminimaris]MCO6046375.1 hypothetical protein [Aeoliella straminimaris]